MPLQGRRESVEPMRRREKIFQRLVGRDVLDAQRNDRNALIDGALDLALDLGRRVGMARKHEHQRLRTVNGVDDGLAVAHAGQDVARRDPTADAFGFQDRAYRIRGGLVLGRVANENVVGHAPKLEHLPRWWKALCRITARPTPKSRSSPKPRGWSS